MPALSTLLTLSMHVHRVTVVSQSVCLCYRPVAIRMFQLECLDDALQLNEQILIFELEISTIGHSASTAKRPSGLYVNPVDSLALGV